MKLKNILLTVLTVACLYSCEDYLDVEAVSSFDSDYVYSNKDEISRALNGVYAQLLNNDTYGKAYLETFCLNSDVDMYVNSNNVSTNDQYRRFDCTSEGSAINKAWIAAYRGIEYANNFVYYLENSPLYDETDADIMQQMGEAKVMRAMFYHDLIVMFGDIPFSLTPTSANDNFVMPVVDREEIHKQLIADLEAIAPYMSFASDLDYGVERVSKEFCWSMIARMALTCGGYSLHPDTANTSKYGTMQRPENYTDYYKITAQYCDSVISSGTHSLALPYNTVFINECNYVVVNNDDPIFEIPFAMNSTGSIGYIQGPTGNNYEGETSGLNIWGKSGGSARLSAFYRFQFDALDLRREFLNGLWYYDYDGTPIIRRDYTVHNNKWSKLWSSKSMGTNSDSNTGINYPYMRYADVLLMYAEALNELNGPGAEAKEALQQVRARAFEDQSKVGEYIESVSTSKEAFLKALLDERKWEFAGENMRWKDLVRNNMYAEVLYYSFLRYYSVAENSAGSSDYIERVETYDGMPGYLELTLPYNIYYRIISNPGDVNIYPNTQLDILEIYNPYIATQRPTDAANPWSTADFYGWWNESVGCPTDQCLYSFFGFIRGDDRGNLYVVDNGALTAMPSNASNLPVVRYILPYPNAAIQRSAGAYQNYYGYLK
ncbi:RagB/SusD family nutrient uptake outer membrane protein [Saccharicrinis sp. FJH2]|uniref:RagB/SusD family nutrient uptake outer membrane protein n=1 Tax=Saccharicrinis sp. FJH65 TaxID=3344659 RepID=UPI0035F30F18